MVKILGKSQNNKEEAESSNIIASGTKIVGNIETVGNLRMEGVIDGNINIGSRAVFSDSSEINGNILAKNAEISGKINGDIEVEEVLTLRATAKIVGNIKTDRLLIEAGAIFNGQCKMGDHF